jgi:thioredoxin-dependent peroxiredoxin
VATEAKRKKMMAAKKTTKKTIEKKSATKVTAKPAAKATTKPAAKPIAKPAVKAATAPEASLVGKKAPAFQLADQSGEVVSSASLKGKAYVLYFYPKDNTPGCTQESCDFRDSFGNFKKAGVTVFGVSPDSVKSHSGFASKYELPFSLLSDPDKTLADAYGVWALKKNYGKEYMGIVRSTFLIDGAGKVIGQWRGVRVKGHVDEVLTEAKSA